MKLLKIIQISSNGSLHFHYDIKDSFKKINRNSLKKNDDKNFKLNQKKIHSSYLFGKKQLSYKKKYV